MSYKHGEAEINCRNDGQLTTGRERARERYAAQLQQWLKTTTSCSVDRLSGHDGHKINQPKLGASPAPEHKHCREEGNKQHANPGFKEG
jgi:hypothetical protein